MMSSLNRTQNTAPVHYKDSLCCQGNIHFGLMESYEVWMHYVGIWNGAVDAACSNHWAFYR